MSGDLLTARLDLVKALRATLPESQQDDLDVIIMLTEETQRRTAVSGPRPDMEALMAEMLRLVLTTERHELPAKLARSTAVALAVTRWLTNG